MTHTKMLLHHGPMSNTERQRKFRKNNPGYYARLRAKRLPATALFQSPAVATPTIAMPSSPMATPPATESVSPSTELTLAAMAA